MFNHPRSRIDNASPVNRVQAESSNSLLSVLMRCRENPTDNDYKMLATIFSETPKTVHTEITINNKRIQAIEFILAYCTPETLRIVYPNSLPKDAVCYAHANLPMLKYLNELQPQVFNAVAVAKALERIITKKADANSKLPVINFLLKFDFQKNYESFNGATLLLLALWYLPSAFNLLVDKMGINHTNAAGETVLHRLVGEGTQKEYESHLQRRLTQLALVLNYQPNLRLVNAAGLTAFEVAFRLDRHIFAYRLAQYAKKQGLNPRELEANIAQGKVVRAALRSELKEVINQVCICLGVMEQRLYQVLEHLNSSHTLLEQVADDLSSQTALLKKLTVKLYTEICDSKLEFEKLTKIETDLALYEALKRQTHHCLHQYAGSKDLVGELNSVLRDFPRTCCDHYTQALEKLKLELVKVIGEEAYRFADDGSTVENVFSIEGSYQFMEKIEKYQTRELLPNMAQEMATDIILETNDAMLDQEMPASAMDKLKY